MRDANGQPSDNAAYEYTDPQSLEVQITDLPPEQHSHYLLLRLTDLKRRTQEMTQACMLMLLRTVATSTRRGNETEQPEDERFAFEISDLPPSTRSHYLLLKLTALKARVSAALPFHRRLRPHRRAPITRAQRRAGIGRVLTALGLCASLALLLVGNVPDLRTQLLTLFRPSKPVPTATPAATVSIISSGQGVPIIVERHSLPGEVVQGTPGPLPAICPQASTLQPFMTPLDPPGLGGGPVWITGFVGPTAALVDLQPLGTSLSHPQGQTVGWYEGLAIFIQRGFTGTITLRGESQGPGGLVFFAGNDVLDFSPIFDIDLSALRLHSLPSGSQWQVTSLNVIVPFAGCYALQAFWPAGTWSRYFAAGS